MVCGSAKVALFIRQRKMRFFVTLVVLVLVVFTVVTLAAVVDRPRPLESKGNDKELKLVHAVCLLFSNWTYIHTFLGIMFDSLRHVELNSLDDFNFLDMLVIFFLWALGRQKLLSNIVVIFQMLKIDWIFTVVYNFIKLRHTYIYTVDMVLL